MTRRQERPILPAERESARLAMWSGMVALAQHLRERLESENLDPATVRAVGREVTQALGDGCRDIIRDSQEHGPEGASDFWSKVLARLQESPEVAPMLWGDAGLEDLLQEEATRLYLS